MTGLTEFRASQLARAAADVADYLLGLKVDLFQTPIAILPATPLATFTAAIATYGGYVQGIVVWEAPSVDGVGAVEVIGSVLEYRPTGSATPNQIYGVYCTDAVSGDLLFAGQLDPQPVPMLDALNRLQVQIVYRPATNSLIVQLV